MTSSKEILTYTAFLSEKKVLDDEICRVSSLLNSPEKDQSIEAIGYRIEDLNDSMIKSISLLPSYDRRLLKDQMKELYTSYQLLKKDARPRPNFGFKLSIDVNSDQKEQEEPSSINLSSTPPEKSLSLPEDPFLHVEERINLYKSGKNSEVNLSDSSFCIYLIHELEWCSLNARHLKDCIVLANSICGPAYISNCQNCTFIIFSYQFRMHDCKDIDVLIACKSNATIENCTRIRFGPNPYMNSFDVWNKIQDFGWLKQTPSPNWEIIPEKDRWDVVKLEEIINSTEKISDIINLIRHK
ncbi:hypothetical protein T552_02146 [Pneumocystis carinii B80]|uniref:C-CAP/cofactor C-like domain-containing protein n=1 Tax=Pneumocystis carinii (strain B80) TaxID=1408658 RepID=A0A0W4ZH57_PNEC8|nr:hypothetical protein T552_02146 [Pneumocystis carinii B80]KTW27706.1 hypothetical protein T552_02146 [Pneumocystis carinii B80]